jgi:hypothetical protein
MPKVKLRVLNNMQPASPKKETPVSAPKKRSPKKKGVRKIDDTAELDFTELNHAELLVLAQMVGIPGASAAATRGMLVEALQTLEPIRLQNPMAVTRMKLLRWIKRHWDRLQMQIPEDYEARLSASDSQVAFYYLKNKDQIT